MNSKPIVGIDLGTTFSALASLDESGKSTIVSFGQDRITPSCIVGPQNEPGTLYVGDVAKNMRSSEAEKGFVCQYFKRDMGTDTTYENKDGSVSLTPIGASAMVLKKLVQEASKTLGEIDEVVITVPASFSEKQRKATSEAGKQAGLIVKHIINEPTAAALAFSTQQNIDGRILIYDLGGGTFDVTIADINGQDIEILTSEGADDLGGVDFDRKLTAIVDKEHHSKYARSLKDALGISSDEDADKSESWMELLGDVEEAKKMLSKRPTTSIKYHESPDGPLILDITRDQFEAEISSLIAQTEMLVEAALDNIDNTPSDIDLVLLVGGSSRVPAVRSSLASQFGQDKISEAVNPDEAVAVGAAIYAGLKTNKSNLNVMQRDKMSKVSMTDVASHYLGFVCIDYDEDLEEESLKSTVITTKDTPLPCSNTERFFTRIEGQEWLRCRVTQSAAEETDLEFVNIVYDKKLGPLPGGRPSGCPVDVTFSLNSNGLIELSFLDVESGISKEEPLELDVDLKDPIKVKAFSIE